jgi:hypothetical protein
MGFLAELKWNFWSDFWNVVQRRGVHVNTPKTGSRVGVFCLGEIWGSHAVLRREFIWGNFKLDFFEDLLVSPRGPTEEGGLWCAFGGIIGVAPCDVLGVARNTSSTLCHPLSATYCTT